MRTNQGGQDDSVSSTSQKFIHTTAVIAGVMFGSATAFAVPELLGVSSLPEAVESLQAFAERVRQRSATEPKLAPQPTEQPASKPVDQPTSSMPRAERISETRVATQLPPAMPQVRALPAVLPQVRALPAVAPLPVAPPPAPAATVEPPPVQPTPAPVATVTPPPAAAAVAKYDALPVIPSPPLVPDPPVTSSIPTAPVPASLAPREIVASAAMRLGDALVASIAILSPDVSAALPLAELKVELSSPAEVPLPKARSDVFAALPLAELKVELPGAAEVPLPKARPDDIPGPSPAERLLLTGAARTKAEKCLAQAIYFEARDQPVRGQSAVAQVVVNRVFSPHYPKDVCGVVYQNAHRHLACQFTFACDGKPETIRERGSWARAQRIARETLDGKVWLPEVAKSTHYHAAYVRPRWVREMKTMARHGLHTFYRPRRWGDGSNEPSWGVASIKKTKG